MEKFCLFVGMSEEIKEEKPDDSATDLRDSESTTPTTPSVKEEETVEDEVVHLPKFT